MVLCGPSCAIPEPQLCVEGWAYTLERGLWLPAGPCATLMHSNLRIQVMMVLEDAQNLALWHWGAWWAGQEDRRSWGSSVGQAAPCWGSGRGGIFEHLLALSSQELPCSKCCPHGPSKITSVGCVCLPGYAQEPQLGTPRLACFADIALPPCSDLALRNCLLTADLTVKVGDYGLSHCKYRVSEGRRSPVQGWQLTGVNARLVPVCCRKTTS